MAWPEEPCATCPRAARGLAGPCRAQATGHRRFCDLANPKHEAHNAGYVALLCDELPAAAPEPATREPSGGTLTPEQYERLSRAENCPYRARDAGCGCSGTRCGPTGHRPGELVNIGICLACVDDQAEAASLPEVAGLTD